MPAVPLTAPSAVGEAGSAGAPAVWSAAEAAEHADRLELATDSYRRLTDSPDPAVRAEAVMRLARVQQKQGDTDEALRTYASLREIDNVSVFGSPVSLEAALARIRILARTGRDDLAEAEASAVRADLVRGRWLVDRPALENAWALVTAPRYFLAAWAGLWNSQDVTVSIEDGGHPVLGSTVLPGPVVTRSPADANLPWTIRVASVSPERELAASARRHQQLWLVLGLAVFLVVAGGYFVMRGLRRELAAAELQSSFVSAVSHELRTPLTSISHLVELLRDRPLLDENRRARYYDALDQEASRLRQFVDQLLDLNRLEAGAVTYRKELIEAGGFVNDVVSHFRGSSSAVGRSIEYARTVPATITIDPAAMAVALNNLLENAVKYSAAGSAIHVQTRTVDQTVNVDVRDYGVGIPAAELERVFERFVRGSNVAGSTTRGTGVGLALAREIVRAHDGDVTVSSVPGEGSVFTITLPVAVTSGRSSDLLEAS